MAEKNLKALILEINDFKDDKVDEMKFAAADWKSQMRAILSDKYY